MLLRLAAHLIVAVLMTAPLAAQPLSRSVLLLDQSSAGLPFNTALATAARLTLNAGSRVPISFYVEHLDANRFFGSEYEGGILSFFRQKYRDMAFDVVVVVGSAASTSFHDGEESSGRMYPWSLPLLMRQPSPK